MDKKKIVISGILVGILLIFLYFNFRKPGFEISDLYIDSTNNGKFVYLMVETESKNSEDMKKWASEVKMTQGFLDMPDKSKPVLVTCYFYNPNDTISLDGNIRNSLKKRYENNPEIIDKVNFVQNGWQYLGHNSKTITAYAKDSIFKTLVFVPKPGNKVADIITKTGK